MNFTVPVPPSSNHLYANAPGKGRVKTTAYRAWIETAGWKVKADLAGRGFPEKFDGGVHLDLCVGVNYTRDVDNVVKPIQDLLKRLGIISDDRRVERVVAYRRNLSPGNVIVTVMKAD